MEENKNYSVAVMVASVVMAILSLVCWVVFGIEVGMAVFSLGCCAVWGGLAWAMYAAIMEDKK